MASARSGEPDRYLAALLAPPPARAGLLALAAFASELARVPALVTREPAMGEIRLQWWREALAASGASARTGNPIADALRAAMHRHDLPAQLLLDTIDAREVDLARQILPDDAALASYLWKSEGALFALAASILRRDPGVDVQAAAVASGQAYGLARLLLGLPHVLARGRVPLPQSRLDASGVSSQQLLSGNGGGNVAGLLASMCAEARKALATSRKYVANLPRHVRAAFLPLALVEPYLRALERPGRDVLRGSGRDRAADARVEDRRGALARPHLTPQGRRAGLRSSREQIDADRCRPEHLPRAHAGRHAARARRRPSLRSCGRSRTPSGSSSIRPIRRCIAPPGRACPRPSAAIPCSRRSGRWASGIQTDGAPSPSPRPAGTGRATATPVASAPTISIPRAIRSWRGWRGSRTRRPSIAAG